MMDEQSDLHRELITLGERLLEAENRASLSECKANSSDKYLRAMSAEKTELLLKLANLQQQLFDQQMIIEQNKDIDDKLLKSKLELDSAREFNNKEELRLKAFELSLQEAQDHIKQQEYTIKAREAHLKVLEEEIVQKKTVISENLHNNEISIQTYIAENESMRKAFTEKSARYEDKITELEICLQLTEQKLSNCANQLSDSQEQCMQADTCLFQIKKEYEDFKACAKAEALRVENQVLINDSNHQHELLQLQTQVKHAEELLVTKDTKLNEMTKLLDEKMAITAELHKSLDEKCREIETSSQERLSGCVIDDEKTNLSNALQVSQDEVNKCYTVISDLNIKLSSVELMYSNKTLELEDLLSKLHVAEGHIEVLQGKLNRCQDELQSKQEECIIVERLRRESEATLGSLRLQLTRYEMKVKELSAEGGDAFKHMEDLEAQFTDAVMKCSEYEMQIHNLSLEIAASKRREQEVEYESKCRFENIETERKENEAKIRIYDEKLKENDERLSRIIEENRANIDINREREKLIIESDQKCLEAEEKLRKAEMKLSIIEGEMSGTDERFFSSQQHSESLRRRIIQLEADLLEQREKHRLLQKRYDSSRESEGRLHTAQDRLMDTSAHLTMTMKLLNTKDDSAYELWLKDSADRLSQTNTQLMESEKKVFEKTSIITELETLIFAKDARIRQLELLLPFNEECVIEGTRVEGQLGTENYVNHMSDYKNSLSVAQEKVLLLQKSLSDSEDKYVLEMSDQKRILNAAEEKISMLEKCLADSNERFDVISQQYNDSMAMLSYTQESLYEAQNRILELTMCLEEAVHVHGSSLARTPCLDDTLPEGRQLDGEAEAAHIGSDTHTSDSVCLCASSPDFTSLRSVDATSDSISQSPAEPPHPDIASASSPSSPTSLKTTSLQTFTNSMEPQEDSPGGIALGYGECGDEKLELAVVVRSYEAQLDEMERATQHALQQARGAYEVQLDEMEQALKMVQKDLYDSQQREIAMSEHLEILIRNWESST